jgi:hypothetical protein
MSMDKLDGYAVPFASFWKAAARFQLDQLAFMTRRTQAYLDLPKTVAKCSSTQALMAEQVRFWEQAQRQYLQQFETALSVIPLPPLVEPGAPPSKVARVHDYLTVAAAKPHAQPHAPAPERTPAPPMRRTA